jgi:hypothetical protein
MGQLSWVFLDNQGGRNRVGLYHGDKTGHLLIHCNMRVVQVDLSVKENKTYTFFIEDELCEIRVHREKEGFSYEFVVNKTADTPLNRARKVEDRRHRKYLRWLIVGMVALILGAFGGLRWYGRWQQERRFVAHSFLSVEALGAEAQLRQGGRTAEARMIPTLDAGKPKVFYGFETPEGLRSAGQFSVDVSVFLLPTGFNLEAGDAFQVTYLPQNPRVHRVDFDAPSGSTIRRYLLAAQAAEQAAHPEFSPERCGCQVLTTAEAKGWQSLAFFIFQAKTPTENARHNRDSYARLVREPQLAEKLRLECGEK